MNDNRIFVPVLVQVALTIYVYLRLVQVKARALKDGLVDKKRVALYGDAWPDSVIQVNNNIRNQFEVPVLFYVLALSLWMLHAVDNYSTAAAWAFVLSRLVHAFVHTGSNFVPVRRLVFTFGVVMVMVLTGLAARALVAS